jgi:hypothetical protein
MKFESAIDAIHSSARSAKPWNSATIAAKLSANHAARCSLASFAARPCARNVPRPVPSVALSSAAGTQSLLSIAIPANYPTAWCVSPVDRRKPAFDVTRVRPSEWSSWYICVSNPFTRPFNNRRESMMRTRI